MTLKFVLGEIHYEATAAAMFVLFVGGFYLLAGSSTLCLQFGTLQRQVCL